MDWVSETGKAYYTCKCPPGTAGENCQYQATAMCVIGSNAAETYGSQHFCVNNGECRDVHSSPDEPFAGCYCPAGYDGMHCEVYILNGTATTTTTTATTAAEFDPSDFDADGVRVSSSNNSHSDGNVRLSSTDVFFLTMGLCAVGILAMIALQKYRAGRRSRKASNILNAFQDSVDEHARNSGGTRANNSAAYHDDAFLDVDDNGNNNGEENNSSASGVLSGDSFSRRGLRRDLEGDVISSSTRSAAGDGGSKAAKSSTSGSKHSFFSGFS